MFDFNIVKTDKKFTRDGYELLMIDNIKHIQEITTQSCLNNYEFNNLKTDIKQVSDNIILLYYDGKSSYPYYNCKYVKVNTNFNQIDSINNTSIMKYDDYFTIFKNEDDYYYILRYYGENYTKSIKVKSVIACDQISGVISFFTDLYNFRK